MAQQQGASPVRAGLTMLTRHAAAQKSSIARTQATAQKRHAPPEVLLAPPEALSAPTMTIGQAPHQTQKPRSRAQKRCSWQPAVEHSSKTTQPRAVRSRKSMQPDMLRATRAAQQAQSGSQRASTLAQRRSQAAEASPPAECSQAADTPLPTVQRSKAARACAAAQKTHTHADMASDGQQSLPCTEGSESADAASVRTEQHPPSPGATGPATPSQASEDAFHPKRPKVRLLKEALHEICLILLAHAHLPRLQV